MASDSATSVVLGQATRAALAGSRPIAALDRMMVTYSPGLDVVRFLAAMWVMLSHAGAVQGGGHAVAVFFVLSGYLIGGQLLEEKRHTDTVQLANFYFKRITRIWPPYFIALIAMIALFVARRQDSVPGFYERAFGALTYTYNIVNDIKGNIHPTWVSFNQIWSLSIEEQFYLVVPLVVAWVPTRTFLPISLLLMGLFYFAVPLYAGLVVGVFLAAALGEGASARSARSSAVFGALAVATFALLFAVGQSHFAQDSWLTYLLSAILVVLTARIWVPTRLHAGLRYLGLMTYSYYLIHVLPGYFLGAAFRHVYVAVEQPVWLNVVFGLLALPISYLFVRYIELPCLRKRKEALKTKSHWIKRSVWIAWGLNTVGIAGLIFIATRA